MNKELIQKLFSKSCWDEQAEVDIEDFISVEKFAELIVIECAMFVVTELEGKVGSAIADATANRLEEHFGVE
jgi:hypothetical protein